ncbi:hypothetical protein CRP01_04955 [Flavilitoribacter nigricans DSM 23189 = NBRC 102662]|uniref:Uncharacterized protein n=1 Tax=Flavilitoribacter nigricans (strain ATCC 23147 / DSM 23189 / NBRC 102662 / NCIMB 1420 / SS-2) TaxID=1122177 RepID=A0A2D0NH52_FLAN2|nr:hypothetical protein CRP01_04955 [Flavilitoribacter nigricans DSM 23189 = NBRC 102662]
MDKSSRHLDRGSFLAENEGLTKNVGCKNREKTIQDIYPAIGNIAVLRYWPLGKYGQKSDVVPM